MLQFIDNRKIRSLEETIYAIGHLFYAVEEKKSRALFKREESNKRRRWYKENINILDIEEKRSDRNVPNSSRNITFLPLPLLNSSLKWRYSLLPPNFSLDVCHTLSYSSFKYLSFSQVLRKVPLTGGTKE